jgi:hypothetical protein
MSDHNGYDQNAAKKEDALTGRSKEQTSPTGEKLLQLYIASKHKHIGSKHISDRNENLIS